MNTQTAFLKVSEGYFSYPVIFVMGYLISLQPGIVFVSIAMTFITGFCKGRETALLIGTIEDKAEQVLLLSSLHLESARIAGRSNLCFAFALILIAVK
jgi:hypothetical protein